MPAEPSAALVVEIGSSTTRVTLVDAVAGETRLIGQAEAPSSIDPPHEDATVAVLDAVARVAELTGRQLLHDGTVLMPQTNERDGVNAILITTSAAGQMAMVIAAVARDISARSALHASRATYTSVLQVITLNDAPDGAAGQDRSWIERQVQRLIALHPDVVLMAGGVEDGADDALVRLAHIIGLTTAAAAGNAGRQPQQETPPLPVIFAGNSRERERVIEVLSRQTQLRIVDNVRPTLDTERLETARRELSQQYKDRVLPRLPGMQGLRRLSARPIRTVCETTGLMTRFLAAQHKRDTLAIDIGSANTAVYLHSRQHYTPTVLGGVGAGFGVGAVLAECGAAAIARWLPFRITEQELVHRLLNKLLRPHSLPVSREDVLIELAVAREAMGLALDALWDERAGSPYDMVVAGGGVLAHAPHPGLAALALLDALQPTAEESLMAIDLHLDTLGLMNACGALAFANPDAALTLFERDLLQNTPLATCIVPLGGGRWGEKVLDAELQVIGGAGQRIAVSHGQIGRLSLAPGRKARLILRPAGHVRIGRNAPGSEVASDVAALSGSELGVIIDARGRPLRLPETLPERQQVLWDWMVALGVESGPLPYVAEALPEVQFSLPTPLRNGDQPFDAPAAPPRQASPAVEADPTPSLDNELARLRQSVEPPKKRGLFRR